MRLALMISAALALAVPNLSYADAASKQKCQRGCNSQCHGAKNKSKCVAQCRRACR